MIGQNYASSSSTSCTAFNRQVNGPLGSCWRTGNKQLCYSGSLEDNVKDLQECRSRAFIHVTYHRRSPGLVGTVTLIVVAVQQWPLVIVIVNSSLPAQNGHHFADDIFKRIFLNENVRISIQISLKFVPKGPIENKSALVQIMAWRRIGGKPLSEPMLTRFSDADMRY